MPVDGVASRGSRFYFRDSFGSAVPGLGKRLIIIVKAEYQIHTKF